MAVALKAVAQSKDNKLNHLFVQATITGNYVTDGVTLDFTAITDPNFLTPILPGPGVTPIISIEQESLSGYYAQVVPPAVPSSLSTYKLTFWGAQATQLTQAAFPAAITGGTLIFQLIY